MRWRIVAAAALALCATLAFAQGYPNKPVKVIVPFTPGSATDILARTIGQKLSEQWGQPVIVENRAGAGGTIGAGVVAKSPPDGYTLMVHSSAHAVNASMYPTLPYDTVKEFVEVATLGGQPNVLVVSPATGFRTTSDLVAAAKKTPGALNYGSAGTAAARTSTRRSSSSPRGSTPCTSRTRDARSDHRHDDRSL
jgi:tripartite-type tricarboxylate transporter receptor subunit TctC